MNAGIRLTLIRHGYTDYTESYPDLTDEGKQQITSLANKISLENNSLFSKIYYVSSPKARTQSTKDILHLNMRQQISTEHQDLGISEFLKGSTSKKIHEANRLIATWFMENYLDDLPLEEKIDLMWLERGNNYPELWETPDEVYARFEVGLKKFLNLSKNITPYSRIIAATHFEVIAPLLQKINLEPSLVKRGSKFEFCIMNKHLYYLHNDKTPNFVPIL